MYLTADNNCETCPENTETCRGPCSICPCVTGYFRNDENTPKIMQFENPRNEDQVLDVLVRLTVHVL